MRPLLVHDQSTKSQNIHAVGTAQTLRVAKRKTDPQSKEKGKCPASAIQSANLSHILPAQVIQQCQVLNRQSKNDEQVRKNAR